MEYRRNGVESSLKHLIDNKLITTEEAEIVRVAYKETSDLDFRQASLLHCDISGNHVFIDGDQITGIIDLGHLTAGDPRLDIATSFAFQTPQQREFFKKGYGEVANDPTVLKYLLIIAAKKAAFRSKIGQDKGRDKALNILRETLNKIK